MDRRPELHELFCGILGNRNGYFQPPASIKLKYPAIVYSLKSIDGVHADNSLYKYDPAFEATLIDHDPDSPLVQKMLELPKCRFDRFYTADGLNHWVFTIY